MAEEYRRLNLVEIVDLALAKLYTSDDWNRSVNVRVLLDDNNIFADSGMLDVVNDKLKALPYWTTDETTSRAGVDLHVMANASGYEFYTTEKSYGAYLARREAKAALIDKAIMDSANATVSAAGSAERSLKIARYSFIWAVITSMFAVIQFFIIQANRKEVNKLKEEFEKLSETKPSQIARPIERRKTPELAALDRRKK